MTAEEYITLWAHKRYPISSLRGWIMGLFYEDFGENRLHSIYKQQVNIVLCHVGIEVFIKYSHFTAMSYYYRPNNFILHIECRGMQEIDLILRS